MKDKKCKIIGYSIFNKKDDNGKETGEQFLRIILGIKSDAVNLIIDGQIEKNNNLIIGIYDKSFTKNNMYSAILGLDILEGGKTNECIADIKI